MIESSPAQSQRFSTLNFPPSALRHPPSVIRHPSTALHSLNFPLSAVRFPLFSVRRIIALFLSALLLWSLIAIVNHYLSPWHVYLFVGGVFVTLAALQLPLRAGLYTSLLAGLLCDAGAGTHFGLHAVLFGLAHGVVFNLRGRLDRDNPAVQVVVALVVNLVLFLGLSLTQIGALPEPGATWWRLLWDLLWSQLALVLIAPWFFAAQRRALVLADPLTAFLERREAE